MLDSWRRRPLRARAELVSDLGARLRAARSFEEKKRVLNEFKDEEMLVADMRQVVDPQLGLVAFSRAITDLAEAVVEEALAACLAEVARRGGVGVALPRAAPLTVLGLGKLGGREMGYASDIELLFVYGPEPGGADAGRFYEQVVQELTAFIAARQEGIFHVDLRLRPHGAKGPLVSPLAAVREYYRAGGGAAAFERQSLVKLRHVAGDASLGAEVMAVRDAFVWSDEPWDRANALHLRDRQCRELVPVGRFNVKYSPGALVEVEYAVQYLQLEHGRARPQLRTPTTLEALDRLAEAELVDPGRARHARRRLSLLAGRGRRAPHGAWAMPGTCCCRTQTPRSSDSWLGDSATRARTGGRRAGLSWRTSSAIARRSRPSSANASGGEGSRQQVLEQLVHRIGVAEEVAPEAARCLAILPILIAEPPREQAQLVVVRGQEVRLRVVYHLQLVLDVAQEEVGPRQRVGFGRGQGPAPHAARRAPEGSRASAARRDRRCGAAAPG